MNKKLFRGYVMVILSAVLYGLMPLMANHIKADGANSYTLVFLRNALSLPLLAGLALWQQKTLAVPVRELPTISLAALFGCCVTPVLLYLSYESIDSGTATVFHFVYPALVVLGGALFLKQKPRAGTVMSVLVCVGVDELLDEGRLALLSRLMDCAPGGAAFAYDEDVLLAAVDPADLSAILESARPLCQGLGCPVVYTQAFDAARIAHRAQLCRMALCVGAGMCVNTRDLCSTLFFMVVERCVSLAPYFCEDVLRVMDDDAQKGTALSRSLYAYLLNFRDMKRAAQQLGMHRNTMEYHMRKTNALIGSVEEEAHRFMLMCTYKMLALPEMNRYGV